MPQQSLRLISVRGIQADPHARRDEQLAAGHSEWGFERHQQLLRESLDVVGPGDLRQDQGEFVPSDAGDGVALPDAAPQPRRNRLQQLVAGGMAEGIVDVLEVIEVQKQHREHESVAMRPRESLLEAVEQKHPVGKPRQTVVMRHVVDELLGLLALDGVPDGAGEQAAVALAFDQVVLGSPLHRLQREPLVSEAAQDDDWHAGSGLADRRDGLETAGVREVQIEKDRIEIDLGETAQCLAELRNVHEIEGDSLSLREHLADQARVARVVLHEQNPRRGRPLPSFAGRGGNRDGRRVHEVQRIWTGSEGKCLG